MVVMTLQYISVSNQHASKQLTQCFMSIISQKKLEKILFSRKKRERKDKGRKGGRQTGNKGSWEKWLIGSGAWGRVEKPTWKVLSIAKTRII